MAVLRLLLVAACTLPSSSLASAIAVKRGQTKVSPGLLPLVCLEIGTIGTSLPLDAIEVENLETHAKQRLVLSSSFNISHPDMLTAQAPGPISLSLPILSLKPGRYQLNSVDFVSGGASSYTMDLSSSGKYWFEVRPGCVNYVGGIEIAADWASIYRYRNEPVRNNEVQRLSFETRILLLQTIKRDAKWACDVVPGLAALFSAESPMHLN